MEKRSKTISKKLISGGITVILIIAICLCMFAFVQKFNKGYVSIFGYSLFKVTTGSMEPTISIGEMILTRSVPIDEIETKDIVSFFSKDAYMNGRIITHRVVDKDVSVTGQIMLTTRGDSNPSTDIHRVDAENFIGKVVWTSGAESGITTVMNFLSSGKGFFTCIAIPTILISVLIFKRCMMVMMVDIKRFKEENESIINGEGDDAQQGDGAQDPNEDIRLTQDDYEDMRARIRAELMEELKTDDNGDKAKTE